MLHVARNYILCLLLILSQNLYSSSIILQKAKGDLGLSQVSVVSIAQDSLGMMWFGTRNGLNRYNGQKNTIYLPDKTDSASILGNHIEKILVQGSLVWAQTRNGLSMFDIRTEQFTNYKISNIISFAIIGNDILYATPKAIFSLKDGWNMDISIQTNEGIKLLYSYNGELFAGTNQRVLKLSVAGLPAEELLSQVNVSSIFVDSRNNIWVGTDDSGAFRIAADRSMKHFGAGKDLSSAEVRCFEETNGGNILIGTFLGLNEISLNDSINHYFFEKAIHSLISDNSIKSLYKDSNGAIWIGTFFGGIDVFHPTEELFNYYMDNNLHNRGLSFSAVGNMVSDSQNNLWICTDGGGLNYFNRASKTFTYYRLPTNKKGVNSQNLRNVYNYNSKLWICTYKAGLYSFDIENKSFTSYPINDVQDYSPLNEIVTSFIPYKGNFLVGTHHGILMFDLQTETFKSFSKSIDPDNHSMVVTSLLISNDSLLWIGTREDGLYIYDIINNHVEHSINQKNNISNDLIFDLFLDSKSRTWIATENGLYVYSTQKNEFDYFSINDGLPSNYVLCVRESASGYIVVSTSKGVCFINRENQIIKIVTKFNGLPLVELNRGGLYITSDSEIFIGGIDGLVSFNEKDLMNTRAQTTPLITSLRVNNKIVVPLDESKILDQSIVFSEHITLRHFHSNFSIEFSDRGLYEYNKQGMEYCLLGFDRDWVNAHTDYVSYMNMSPGEYTFVLRMLDEPSLQTVLKITIKPPFFKTIWALLIYIIVVSIMVISLTRLWLRQKDQRREKELNQAKLNFFTNISHEFRTPLTLIAGQTELLLENYHTKPSEYKKLLNIHKNTTRLKNLISELLDFKKQEAGFLKIRVGVHDIVGFLEEIFHSFIELSRHSKIDYRISYPHKPVFVWFDRYQMEKVFYNLLSNAFKHTPSGGSIRIEILLDAEELCIHVKDSGYGMSAQSMDKIFDRFFQIGNISTIDNQGTGIGLALSKGIVEAHGGKISVKSTLGKGSTFTVRLLIGNKHYDEEELENPIVKDHIADDDQAIEKITVSVNKKKASLLLVEDDPDVRNFLRELLSPFFEISLAYDGLEGMEKAYELQPEIILSDVLMPRMSGTEMCSKLKTNLNTSHIPIVLLTARTAEEHKIEGLDTGADDYITKPFNTRVLIARLNNILNNRKELQLFFSKNPSGKLSALAKNKIDQEFMDKAKTIIENNLDDSGYNMDRFAEDLNLGRTNLYCKMKALTGKTPNEFITIIRLEKSMQMLKLNPELTIAEIAYSCGFSSPDYFGRLFKKHFGMIPSKSRSGAN